VLRVTALQAMTHPFFADLRDAATLLPNGARPGPMPRAAPGRRAAADRARAQGGRCRTWPAGCPAS